MKAKIYISYKEGILDPQGKTVGSALDSMGIDGIEDVRIGKYIELHDAYKSIAESFTHAGVKLLCKIKLIWISSDNLTSKNIDKKLKNINGILVAPGFGSRGIKGKIIASNLT